MNNEPKPDGAYDAMDEAAQRDLRAERLCSVARNAANFLLIAGGATVLGLVVIPVRTSGSSRSARLEWQRRKAETSQIVPDAQVSANPRHP
jgi:hypothetical protein